ncbi:MAG: ABC transporter permease subunit [Nitratireductor sp.]
MRRSLRPFVNDLVVRAAVAAVVFVLAAIVVHVVTRGAALVSWDFLTTAPRAAGRAGGIAPVLVSTAAVTAVALAAALPLAGGAAVFLVEAVRPHTVAARLTRGCLGVLAAVPSIVFGLAGNMIFCDWLGFGFSILAGGLTLALMILPIAACVAETTLRMHGEDRRAGYALGLPQRRIVWSIMLPAAAPGIFAGLGLGFGRAVAESAALIFTSGYVVRMPDSVFDSGRTMAVHILDLAMNVPGGDGNAFATATVLLVSVAAVVALFTALDGKQGREFV